MEKLHDKRKLLKQSKLCVNCLKPTNSKHCSNIFRHLKRSVVNCGQRHQKLLHNQPPMATTENPTNATLTGLAVSMKEAVLQPALARLLVNGQEVTFRVLLDFGSQQSYIRNNIAESIGCKAPQKYYVLQH